MEGEDLTFQHSQIHIRRVCVIVQIQSWVTGSVCLCCENEEFRVEVVEDGLEIIDFGPWYSHANSNFVDSKEPDDEQSVAESKLGSEPESIEDFLPDGMQD